MSTANNPNSPNNDVVVTKSGGAGGGDPSVNISGRAPHAAGKAVQSATPAKVVAGPGDVAGRGAPSEAALLLPNNGEKPTRLARRKKTEDEDQQADRSADSAGAESGDGLDPAATLSDDVLLLAQADTGGGAGTAAAGGGATASGTGSAAGTGAAAGTEAAGAATTTAAGMSTAGMLAVAAVAVGVAAGAGGGGGSTSSTPAPAPGPDTTAPVIQSISAQAGAVVLTYNEALDATVGKVPVPGDFAVTVNGVPNAVTAVVVAGTKVTLTLTVPVVTGDTVNVTYTDPTGLNDVAAIQDAAGNDAIGFATGVVADGYIRGAQIYIDTNNNGLPDAGEALAGVVTNANGNFILPAGAPAGVILATGGVNIDTGVPNVMVFKAPAGSTVISPLTTLVQTMIAQNPGTSVATASAAVVTALGLAGGTDLTTYDPLAALAANPADAAALTIQKAAAQIATLVDLASDAPAGGSTSTQVAAAVVSSIVTQIGDPTAPTVISLTDVAVITAALGTVSTASAATIDTQLTTIDTAVNLGAVTTAQAAALDTTAPAAPTSLTLTGTVSDTGTTGDNMTNDSTPVVRVNFNSTATDGTAAVIGNTVKVYEAATQVGTATLTATDVANGYIDVTLTTALAGDGSHSLTAKIDDIVPNTSAVSTAYTLALDTVAPTTAPTVALTSDTGSSSSDGITKVGTLVVGGIGAGNTAQYSIDGGTTWTSSFTAAAGVNNVDVRQIDAAGNGSPTASLTFTYDTTVAAPVIDVVATDNIINASEQASVITGTNEAGATVALTIGANTRAATVTGTTWSYTLVAADITAMGEGAETLSAIQTDLAGNVSTAGTRAISVDTVVAAPVISTVAGNDIINASEAGSAITGTAEAGASVALTLGTGNTRTVTADGSGNWTYTLIAADITAMGEGAETLSATQTDVAGNTSAAGTRGISIDTAVPSAPTINAVATDDTINASEAGSAITGTNEAGAAVALSIGGNTRAATVTGTTWSYTLVAADITAMGEGAETLSATQTDAAGNVSAAGTRAISVDTVALAPTIDAVAADNIINASEQTAAITGTNEAGATVALTIGANTRAPTVTGTTWSYTLTAGDITAMGEGAETLSATQTDAAGNVSTAGTRPITVDTAAPTLSSSTPADNATEVVGSSIVLNFNESVAAGAGNIALFDGTNTLNIAVGDTNQVAISGSTVTITPSVGPAPNTTYTVTVASGVFTDVAGNAFAGIASGDLNFTMANNPSVTITTDEGDNLLNVADTATITFTLSQASIDFVVGDITVAGGTLSNFAGSGTTYTATLTPATSSTTAATVSVGAGAFTSNSLGNIASSTFSINVDTVPPVAPTVALTSDTGSSGSDKISSVGTLNVTGIEGGATTQYSTDGGTTFFPTFTAVEGANSVQVRQKDVSLNASSATTLNFTLDTAAPSAPTFNTVATDNIINAAEVGSTISGTNEAGATVALSIGANTRAATVSGTTWSYTLGAADITEMGQGAETLSAIQTDAAGNTSAAGTRSISVDTGVPSAPTIDAVATDNIINASEQTAAITGTNEAGATVALTIGANTRAATVTGTTWSYTLVADDIAAMGEGAETLSATQTDAAGNVSTAGTRAINVDTVALAPTINAVATDNIINASEQTAAVTGTAEAGATIALTLGTGNTRSVTADGSGNWTYTLIAADIAAMGEGAETLSATQTDAAGNVSTAGTRAISVDTVALAPTINAVATDNIINASEQTATITGTNEAGATVALTIGTNVRPATVAGTTWSYTLTAGDITAMGEGAETLSATQTDAAGNASTAGTRAITLDTGVPTLASSTPADNATAVSPGANIVLTFSENVAAGTGNIVISDGTNSTIAVTDATQVSFSGTTVIINPTADLNPSTAYNVQLDSGVITDVAGNAFAGITTPTTLNFTTAAAPTLTSNIDNVTNFDVTSNIVLTASTTVTAVAGKFIYIINDGGAGFRGEATVNTQTIAATDTTKVTISGDTIIINPGFDLDLANSYHIEVESGAFLGGGVGSIGVSSATAMDFATVTPGTTSAPAASQAMTTAGGLAASFAWADIEGVGATSNANSTNFDLSSGNIAMVFKDNATGAAGATDGIDAPAFWVNALNFGVGDLLYIDNQSNANPNDLAKTTFGTDTPARPSTEVVFGSSTSGQAWIDISPAGASTSVESFLDPAALQLLLGTTYVPIVSG